MAAREAEALGLAPACLCVLCGLPAAGKSTFATGLVSAAVQRGWRAAVIPYDDLIPDEAFRARKAGDIVGLQEPVTSLHVSVCTSGNIFRDFCYTNKLLPLSQCWCRFNKSCCLLILFISVLK